MLDAIPDASHREARPWESGGKYGEVSSLLNTGGCRPPHPSPKVPAQSWVDQTVPLHTQVMGPLRKGPVSDSATPGLWPVSQEMLFLYSWSWATIKG